VASFLPLLDESGPLQSPNHFPRGQRRKLGHGSNGNSHPSLK
jgi:hypothetical protein